MGTKIWNLTNEAKKYLLVFLSGIATAFLFLLGRLFGAKLPTPKVPREWKSNVDNEKKLQREQEEKTEARKEESKTLEDQVEDSEQIRKKIITGTLPLILILVATLSASAASTTSSSTPFIPSDYETLKKYYLECWNLSERYRSLVQQYQQLYQSAEQSCEELKASNKRLQEIIEQQQIEINNLKAPHWGLTGGVTYSPGTLGGFLGITFN